MNCQRLAKLVLAGIGTFAVIAIAVLLRHLEVSPA